METIDIWVFPGTPTCEKVAQIVGRDRRVRLIDARKYRAYLPAELTKVPGFVFTAKDGKRYPWEGEQCVDYVSLYFGAQNHLVGALAGTPVQDVRDHAPDPSWDPRMAPAAYPPNQQPPQSYPPSQHQQPPQSYPPAQRNYPATQAINHPSVSARPPRRSKMGFGNRTYSDLARVQGGSVIAISDSQMAIAGQGPARDIMAERARQDAMYLPKR